MKKLIREIRSSVTGVSAVEFALTFPIFIILIIGILEAGAAFLSRSGLNHGVAEAARYATIYPTPSEGDILKQVGQRSFGIDQERLRPTITRGEEAQFGPYIIVSATYEHTSLSSLTWQFDREITATRKVWIQPSF